MQRDYERFQEQGVEILAVGPETPEAFRSYWEREGLSFVGLADPTHSVLKRYGQEVNLFRLGRMPAQVLIDRNGVVRYVHYGHSMMDIPTNEHVFGLIHTLDNAA